MGFNISNARICKVRRATDQTLTTATATAVSFSTSVFNPNGLAEFVTNPTRITVDRAGIYLVEGGVVFAADSTGVRTLQIKKNGVASTFPGQVNQAAPATGTGIMQVSAVVQLDNTDYVELIATHTKGSDLAISADTTAFSPYFAVSLLYPIFDGTANAEQI